MKKFVARRGTPKLMVSDNAKTFAATKNGLESLTEILGNRNFFYNKYPPRPMWIWHEDLERRYSKLYDFNAAHQ